MAMYVLRDVDPQILRAARERAKAEGIGLAALLHRLLARYARSGDAQAAGGRARAANRTTEELSAIGRLGAAKRWGDQHE